MTVQRPLNEEATFTTPEDTTASIQPASPDQSSKQGTTRRQFLGNAAKSALVLAGASSLSTLASACGSSSSKSQVTLTWYREGNPDEIAFTKKIVDKFMAENPDI